ncbi:YihY/virulence factor BrkB family protein [Actinocorallia longicatena]|uniref:YihY/virulence factor BrkB family protein n=1 Tax=Actinocorallia longicatena TaxID=111803 RepID=A0ABP6Q2X3_9ACTN
MTRKARPEDEGTAAPEGPTDLAPRSWRDAIRRTLSEFQEDGLADWAASLTYYSVLSIFPALLVIVSLVGLGGQSVSDQFLDNVGDLAPGAVKDVLDNALTELGKGRSGAGVVALLSLAGAFWSASGYVGAFMRASNVVYDVPEGRPIWKTLPLRVAITFVTLVLLSVSAVAVVVSGPIAQRVGDLIGLGPAAVTTFNIVKWPILILIVSGLIALLYWASPNAKQGFRWVTPGGTLAMALWLAASAGFGLYVANFGSYNKTYGSLAALIVFLVWLWLTNLAILLGAELNAELERSRAISAGLPPTTEPYLELRDTHTLDDPPPNPTLPKDSS